MEFKLSYRNLKNRKVITYSKNLQAQFRYLYLMFIDDFSHCHKSKYHNLWVQYLVVGHILARDHLLCVWHVKQKSCIDLFKQRRRNSCES